MAEFLNLLAELSYYMMKKPRFLPRLLRFLFLLPFTLTTAWAGEENGASIRLDDAVGSVADFMEKIVFFSIKVAGQGLPIVLAILGGTAIFLTIYFKFINLSSLGLAFRTVRGKYTPDDAPGQITHFQALTAALSATVGLGNIAGVAVAVSLGGPGATFWMIVMGLCGMTTKFCECTLGVKYREIDETGRVHGGAMYYLSRGLKEKGLGGLGRVLAIFFAIMCIGGAIGAGNMFQVNQATEQVMSSFNLFGGNTMLFGVALAIFVGLVIIGGIVWIARVTSFLVPFMCGIYVLAALAIIFGNLDKLGDAVSLIFTSAFSPMAVGGGLVGVLIQGIKRAAFSNEAGIGSAPIAHAAVKTKKPASEGIVALLEPFTDTVVVCTMTALVLIITGVWKVDAIADKDLVNLYQEPARMEQVVMTVEKDHEFRLMEDSEDGDFAKVWQEDGSEVWVANEDISKVAGIGKTSRAFGERISWFPNILAIAVVLFAFSTMISWAYYGEQAVIYLCGRRIPGVVLGYKIIFCLFVIVGAVASLGNIIRLSDAMLFAMVLPNMIGLYVLLPVVKKELGIFREHVAKVEAGGGTDSE
jgi:AGCS family alanine or glycine:cation symporter